MTIYDCSIFFGVTAVRVPKLKTGYFGACLWLFGTCQQEYYKHWNLYPLYFGTSHKCHGATERLELGAFLLHKSLFLIIYMKLLPPVMYFLSEKLKLPDHSLLSTLLDTCLIVTK